MGKIRKYIFRSRKVVRNMTLSTTSTSAIWSPTNIVNTGTLTWDVTGDITPTSQYINDPTFDLSANTGVVNMNIYDVGSLTQCEMVSANITTLDVTKAINLQRLNIADSQISSLNVTNNINLIVLALGLNNITTIDLSNNTLLTDLYTQYNPITSLNLSTNTLLTSIYSDNMNIATLDLSNNINLTTVQIQNNNLSDTVTNSILASLVSHNKSNGILRYRNNETGQGITDRAILVTRGWTITNYAT